MPIGIHELRPEGLSDALAFAASCGSDLSGGRVLASLSLAATDGSALVAAAICVEQPGNRHRVEVCLKSPDDEATHRALVDKALMKLDSHGVRKFDIRTNGSAEQGRFWRSVSWIDQALGSGDGGEPRAA